MRYRLNIKGERKTRNRNLEKEVEILLDFSVSKLYVFKYIVLILINFKILNTKIILK